MPMSNTIQLPIEQAETKNVTLTASELNKIIEQITPDLDLTEIINGEEIMAPSPFGEHQTISIKLVTKIVLYLEKNKVGNLYHPPLDVILEEGLNRLQPDLLFIKKENMSIFQDWIRGVPDMVCEIVSKGTHKKDTITKKDIYEYYKVPEYWIVIPQLQTFEIFTIENDKYRIYSSAEAEGIVKSKVIEGLEINIKDVFLEQS
ncbi:restriction endonuclease [Candidatus Magnetoovum chiemensis]|nr:restriction endonuclease [Candidatus Magnetoovum chiemensis]